MRAIVSKESSQAVYETTRRLREQDVWHKDIGETGDHYDGFEDVKVAAIKLIFETH